MFASVYGYFGWFGGVVRETEPDPFGCGPEKPGRFALNIQDEPYCARRGNHFLNRGLSYPPIAEVNRHDPTRTGPGRRLLDPRDLHGTTP